MCIYFHLSLPSPLTVQGNWVLFQTLKQKEKISFFLPLQPPVLPPIQIISNTGGRTRVHRALHSQTSSRMSLFKTRNSCPENKRNLSLLAVSQVLKRFSWTWAWVNNKKKNKLPVKPNTCEFLEAALSNWLIGLTFQMKPSRTYWIFKNSLNHSNIFLTSISCIKTAPNHI